MFEKHYKTLEAAQDYLASVVEKYVEETVLDLKCGKNTNSILAKLLEIADRKDVFTMVLDMFLAGIDTTAYTMAFCLYNLAMNQRVQDTLRTELKDRLPTKSNRISESDAKLRYLQLVIK
ncbi:Cytochrome P450 302a1, mitochondrial, partial [Stegodyphus mimosarum]